MRDWKEMSTTWSFRLEDIWNKQPGSYLESKEYSWDVFKWNVRFYPYGRNAKFRDYVTLAVVFKANSMEPKFYIGSISLLDFKGVLIKGGWCPSKFNKSFIDDKFIENRELFARVYSHGLITIELTIYFKLDDLKKYEFIQSSEMELPLFPPSQSIITDQHASVLRMYMGAEGAKLLSTDITTSFNSSAFEVQEPVDRDPSRKAVVERYQSDIEDERKVSEFNSEDMKILTELMLTEEIKVPNFETGFFLLRHAGKFQNTDLKKHCGSYLAKNFTTDNVCCVLELNDQDSYEELTTAACDFAIEKWEDFLEHEYDRLVKTAPHRLTRIFMGLKKKKPQNI